MVDLSSAASMANLFLTAGEVADAASGDGGGDQTKREAAENAESGEGGGDQGESTADKLDRLLENDEKLKPTAGDKDAFASTVVELENGEVAEIVVEPVSGWNLRVREVHLDRRAGHEYEINVGGDITSVSHRAKYASPRTVTQSDRVVATVINESGQGSVVDFEMEAWAERPDSDGRN